jgi:Domain of unknown function (DUF5753)/Helix-turn-helix domain
MTAEEVTEQLLFSPTKLSRIETGQSGASARDIRDLCELYEVSDIDRDNLTALAREGKQRGWWQDYALPYATYVGLEAEANSIDVYQSGVVPGLLQTEEYVRAMLRTQVPPFSQQELQQRVRARLTRQDLLSPGDAGGLGYHAVLDEAALHRRVGGEHVMATQLARLIEFARQPNIDVLVIPFEAGAHPAMESDFCILNFDQPFVSDVVYIEGLVGNIYLEKPGDIERYQQVFSRLRALALSQHESNSLIKRIAESYT